MSEDTATAVVEATPEVVTKKVPVVKTGDLISDTAKEVETMNKPKALNEAIKLADQVETSYFRLGGILKRIDDNSWWEGYPDFDTYVYETFGFQNRKARYLMSIYDNLVTKGIPWEKVSHLGWTKLKEIVEVINLDNLDEWIKKAEDNSVTQLQALKSATKQSEGEVSGTTKSDVVKMSFAFKSDQAEAVQGALAKAKGELGTTFDTVALENICLGYVGGNTNVMTLKDQVIAATQTVEGMQEVFQWVADVHPEYQISVVPATAAATT